MNSHYLSERKLRQEIFKIRSEADRRKAQLLLAESDLENQALRSTRKILKLANDKSDLELRIAQRETGLKFQIDHNMAWAEFYRLSSKTNQKAKVLKGSLNSIKKLITFDKARQNAYKNASEILLSKLKHYQLNAFLDIDRRNRVIKAIADKIVRNRVKWGVVKRAGLRGIGELGKQVGQVQGVLDEETEADRKRMWRGR